MPEDKKKKKKNLYTVRANGLRANPIKLKAGGAKKKKKTPAKKKAGSIRGIRRQLGSSTGRYGKIRRTTPRLYYAPIVPGIPETAAMRGWGRFNNRKKKKCQKKKDIHRAPVEYEPIRAGKRKKQTN